MRLSEAIRLGAMMKPQAFGALLVSLLSEQDGVITVTQATCAIGAAYDACGLLAYATSGYSVAGVFPVTKETRECPACDYVSSSVDVVVTHLNDTHRWSREQIADWVETLEPREESPEAQTEAAVARAPQEA